jgi:1-acyl-sn-glycerol-3-phosphate acyltransferase
VVKDSLLDYPLFGRILKDLNPITVTRRHPKEDFRQVLEKGTQEIERGLSVIVFPQSTRTPYFAPADFNSLGVKLARRAGVRVIPVALRTDFQSVGRIFRDFGHLDRKRPIHFKFGAPIPVEGNGRQAHERATEFITTQLREWGVEIRGGPGPGE